MKIVVKTLCVFALVLLLVLAAGCSKQPAAGRGKSGEAAVLYYTCPMHPHYRSDHPGEAPCCGMRLVPVFADGSTGGTASAAGTPGALQVGLDKQQLIGVRVVKVRKDLVASAVRASARVAADETRIYRMNASTELWVRAVFPLTAGNTVKKGETLLAFYSTNFQSAASSYLFALDTMDRLKASKQQSAAQTANINAQIRQAVESLQNLGVSDIQIHEMSATRKAGDLVYLRSPTDGLLLNRSVTQGQYLSPGTEMYQIADLSRIWIYADLFETEARSAQKAAQATVRYQGKAYQAHVSNVLPRFDAATRTLKLRLEMDNPNYAFRPDMFVDVEFPVQMPSAITVPVDAVVDSGLRKTVYIDKGNGYFEPRQVETGGRMGDRVEITKGLMAGERIVVSGTFLIDSESRMKMTASAASAPAPTPAPMPMPAKPAAESAAGIDPVCGMTVTAADAGEKKSVYRGKTYYFCSAGCKKDFDKDPEKYLGGAQKHD
jgi:membrane fusion protein, copper/silver efflux system